jgi:hypothetical protein
MSAADECELCELFRQKQNFGPRRLGLAVFQAARGPLSFRVRVLCDVSQACLRFVTAFFSRSDRKLLLAIRFWRHLHTFYALFLPGCCRLGPF